MNVEEVKLIYRNKTKADQRPEIREARQAHKMFLNIWDLDQIELVEESKALFLDCRKRLMSYASISKGGLSATVVDLRVVFAIALKRRADSIILAHNHPSGHLTPSKADIRLTKEFRKAGELLKIPLLDHLIISREGHYSILHDL